MNKAVHVVAIAFASIALASCSGPRQAKAPEPAGEAAAQGVPSGAVVEVAASNAAAPWYAKRFDELGFYSFPTPEPLPPFSVPDLSGKAKGLADLSGKVVLLNFWATWCPPCRQEMPSIQILHDTLEGAAFEVMAISVSEAPSVVANFVKANPYTFPLYLDESGSVSAPFVGRGIPTTFVLDKQGRAIAGVIGARSYDDPKVVSLFRELAERLP
ncbi:MAG: TlpA family protein disulfide reductase [Spirochaetes bacterium]|nr:TlpA family protein disulfide reductase [Spirochaetota bacterium]MBU1082056.1 TlpA family protein disulfide reductase [Spirochaetota bacterium]